MRFASKEPMEMAFMMPSRMFANIILSNPS